MTDLSLQRSEEDALDEVLLEESYSAGPEAGGDFGLARIYTKTSRDGGTTWEDERLVADIGAGDINVMSPVVCRTPDALLLGYGRDHSMSDTSVLVHRSTDEGRSFDDPVPIWQHIGEYRILAGSAAMVRLEKGRLALPYERSAEAFRQQSYSAGVMLSDDEGATWKQCSEEARPPMRGDMEPSVAELPDGELVMSLRTQLGAVFLSRSPDGGDSWTPPQTTGLRSSESCTCLRRIPGTSRRILLWNRAMYRPGMHHFGVRTPLSVAISDDRGATWRHAFDIENDVNHGYTNLDCAFLGKGSAIVTYMATRNEPDGGFGRSCIDLKAALVPRELLSP